MVLVNRKDWKLILKIKPKGENFFWKPNFCGVKKSFHRHENGVRFKYVNTFSYYIQTQIWVTWLFWTIRLHIIPEQLQEHPFIYFKYEKGDLEVFQLTHGSNKDPNKYES